MAAATRPAQNQRTVLITGCSDGGLASALALEFHKEHSIRVFATARTSTKLAHLATIEIDTLTLNVLDAASITACVAESPKLTNGSLDLPANNARRRLVHAAHGHIRSSRTIPVQPKRLVPHFPSRRPSPFYVPPLDLEKSTSQ